MEKYNLERVLLTSVVASFQEAGGKKQQALIFCLFKSIWKLSLKKDFFRAQ